MAHFYLDETLEAADAGPGAAVVLGGAEARHAVTVSRLRAGERVRLGNGRGLVLDCLVERAEATGLALRVEERRVLEATTPRILLAQALAKGGRDELAVQAATELGVDGVIPWEARRSVVRWQGAKRDRGAARWSAIVREAVKQSMRPWLPEVLGPRDTESLAVHGAERRLVVLDPGGDASLVDLEEDGRDVVLVVGPEGGVDDAELAVLEAAGARRVRLGDAVLRTSTAGPAALAVLRAVWGRL